MGGNQVRILIATLLLAASLQGCTGTNFTTRPQHSSYRLVLAVDKTGKVESGSKPELEQAVRAGREIQIGWALDWDDDGVVDIEHWAAAAFITIYRGEIFAQQPMILQQMPKADTPDIDLGGTTWAGLIATTGLLRGMFQGVNKDSDAFRVASWWYVQED
jgi:hypothetical protein